MPDLPRNLNLIEMLRTRDDFESNPNQSEDTINKYEKGIGLQFPDEYRKFLANYGYAAWFGGELFGISQDDYFDVLSRTDELRSLSLPDDFHPVDKGVFVVSEYPGGGYFLMYAKGSQREGQISLILNETFFQEEQSWGSLQDFIRYYWMN